jgi:hypothetical protein
MVTENIWNKQSRTADKGLSASLGIGRGVTNSHRKRKEHVARCYSGYAWKRRKRTQNFGRKPEGKRPLGRPRHRWEDNIKFHLREIVWKVVDWIHLAQDRDQWLTLVNTVMTQWVP